ncbi:MAG: hypothetical protein OXI25_08100 [Chloroflexota bacterium]|nr:hypothetical protein [Chloroflexota bacterium]
MSNRAVLVVSIIALALGAAALAVAVSGQRQDAPAPDKSDPAAYTVAFVQGAIDRYERDGRDATIAYYNTRDGIDGQWYVFIIGEDDRTIGHYNPAIRGRDPTERVDITGYYYGPDTLATDEEGRWVTYVFHNPGTNRQELKHAWVIKHDGLIFGSGWYERHITTPAKKSDPAAYTVEFVQGAIDRYERDGREATIAHYSTRDSVDGQWYVFIIDENDRTVGHWNPAVRGFGRLDRVDATGYYYGPEMLATDEEGRWVTYVFLNPQTNRQDLKHAWVVRHDGLIFGSGWYERLVSPRPDKSDPAAYTVALVRDAIGRYEREGREAAFAYFDSAENEDGQWYAYVLEDGRIAAHPRPELRGADVAALTDIVGYNFGPDLLATDEEGSWLTYVFLNIANGRQELKHSWSIRHDGLIFGSGWHERYAGEASGG